MLLAAAPNSSIGIDADAISSIKKRARDELQDTALLRRGISTPTVLQRYFGTSASPGQHFGNVVGDDAFTRGEQHRTRLSFALAPFIRSQSNLGPGRVEFILEGLRWGKKKPTHTGPRELDGHPGGVWVGVWFSSRLYYPFGKGPGQHIIRCLKNKKCENETPSLHHPLVP